MIMKVLITLLGRSGWGMFNSVWAMIRTHDYVPEKIYIVVDGCHTPMAESVRTNAVLPGMRARLSEVLAADLPNYNDLKEGHCTAHCSFRPRT